jgi:transcriptional regulator GlxA family with amidase domain
VHRVVAVARPEVLLFELAIPQLIFNRALYGFAGQAGDGESLYEVQICGEQPGPIMTSTGIEIKIVHGLELLHHADTIVVPGVAEPDSPVAAPLIEALRAAARAGTRIAAICSGAFVLAAAGLLDRRTATTYSAVVERFRQLYPEVNVDTRRLYVDEGPVLTSAGSAAGIDLLLHMIRSDLGMRAASYAAGRVVATYRDGEQAPPIERSIPDSRGDALERTREWMTENMDQPLTVPEMAAHANMGVRTFTRHFHADTGRSPLQWLLQQRIAYACELLETSDATIQSVARRCGFSSTLSLRQHFVRLRGSTPSQYRTARSRP